MARNLVVAPTLGLATYPAGRAALRQGAAKWYLTQVWEEGGGRGWEGRGGEGGQYPAGRAALRQGAAKWYLTQDWEERGGGRGRYTGGERRGGDGCPFCLYLPGMRSS